MWDVHFSLGPYSPLRHTIWGFLLMTKCLERSIVKSWNQRTLILVFWQGSWGKKNPREPNLTSSEWIRDFKCHQCLVSAPSKSLSGNFSRFFLSNLKGSLTFRHLEQNNNVFQTNNFCWNQFRAEIPVDLCLLKQSVLLVITLLSFLRILDHSKTPLLCRSTYGVYEK
jgi:hypothetical protein